jgi:ubiquinone/menaquinone biosynthesis C-methylase UbiE
MRSKRRVLWTVFSGIGYQERFLVKKDPYGNIAKWYDTIFQSMNTGLIAKSMELFPPEEGMSVLDVGCGTGIQLTRYQSVGCEIFGIDPSPAMLATAREKLGNDAKLHLGDAAHMPYANGCFDRVTAMLVLHEMSTTCRDAVMVEAKRVLRKNGRILLIDFHPGPLRPLKGWFNKALITFFEMGAGREHFRNYRDFIACKGIPRLASHHGLMIEAQRVVSGGNLGIFLLRSG